jgi:hypothetical protein
VRTGLSGLCSQGLRLVAHDLLSLPTVLAALSRCEPVQQTGALNTKFTYCSAFCAVMLCICVQMGGQMESVQWPPDSLSDVED